MPSWLRYIHMCLNYTKEHLNATRAASTRDREFRRGGMTDCVERTEVAVFQHPILNQSLGSLLRRDDGEQMFVPMTLAKEQLRPFRRCLCTGSVGLGKRV